MFWIVVIKILEAVSMPIAIIVVAVIYKRTVIIKKEVRLIENKETAQRLIGGPDRDR